MTMFDRLPAAAGMVLLWLATPGAQAARHAPSISPLRARAFALDKSPLEALVRKLLDEQAEASNRLAVNLPMPDGSALTFQAFATEVMAPGLHGQIFTPQGEVYIDPQGRGDVRHHHSDYTRDLAPRARVPDTVLRNRVSRAPADSAPAPATQVGPVHVQRAGLRTYRLAIATTGEYAAFQDPDHAPPDLAIVLAEFVALTNRVTGIYEREAGVRLQLTANTDALIFTDPATDPFDDQNGFQILEANTAVFNTTVGEGSYDIGHTVSTGGGGVAGLPEPVGDAFYVD